MKKEIYNIVLTNEQAFEVAKYFNKHEEFDSLKEWQVGEMVDELINQLDKWKKIVDLF